MEEFATEISPGNEFIVPDSIRGPFAGQEFRFYHTDPATGRREVKEIGG